MKSYTIKRVVFERVGTNKWWSIPPIDMSIQKIGHKYVIDRKGFIQGYCLTLRGAKLRADRINYNFIKKFLEES